MTDFKLGENYSSAERHMTFVTRVQASRSLDEVHRT